MASDYEERSFLSITIIKKQYHRHTLLSLLTISGNMQRRTGYMMMFGRETAQAILENLYGTNFHGSNIVLEIREKQSDL